MSPLFFWEDSVEGRQRGDKESTEERQFRITALELASRAEEFGVSLLMSQPVRADEKLRRAANSP